MADEEQLKRLRAMGVKSATYLDGELVSVEFFPVGLLPDFGRLDAETLVPPPPTEDGPPNVAPRIPPAMAAILKKGSVS